MAASTYTITLSNGQSISCYQPAGAVEGTPIRVNMMGKATVTTVTYTFGTATDCYLFDIIVDSTLTAGGFEIFDVTGGARTSVGVPNLEAYTLGNNSRRCPPLGFRAGRTYQLLQSVAGNA